MSVRVGPGHLRAEYFAAVLDGAKPVDSRTSDLVAVVGRLRSLPLDPPSRSNPATRALVVGAAALAAAELAHHSATNTVPLAPRALSGTPNAAAGGGHLLVPLLSGLMAATLAVSGAAVAAHRSLPGQPFYVLKSATERLQLDFAPDAAARARARLGFALARLSELRQLSEQFPSPEVIARSAALLASLERDIGVATGPLLAAGGSDVMALWQTAQQAAATLAVIRASLPAVLQDPANRVLTVLNTTQSLASAALSSTPGGVPGGAPAVTPTRPAPDPSPSAGTSTGTLPASTPTSATAVASPSAPVAGTVATPTSIGPTAVVTATPLTVPSAVVSLLDNMTLLETAPR